jgi:hypothetical protein
MDKDTEYTWWESLKYKMSSRKFWMAVVSAVIIICNEGLGLDLPTETLLSFAAVVAVWIWGEAHVDGVRMLKE